MTHQNEAPPNEIVGDGVETVPYERMRHLTGSGRARLVDIGLRHFVLIVGVFALGCYAWIYARNNADVPIRSDGFSYYVYLPSVFLYRDATLDALGRDWFGGTYPEFAGILRWPSTGRWVNPHPIGPAVLSTPFFVAGHLLTLWSNLPPDGLSLYYQHSAGLAGLAYLLAGIAVLRRLLVRHFSPAVVLATLITMTWGTNLFHYGVYDSTFSHAFSFFLITSLVALTELWWDEPGRGVSALLGLTAALIVLTRHTNAIFLLVPLLYGLPRGSGPGRVRRWWGELLARRTAIALGLGVAAVAVLPQLVFYKYATGSWLVSPYAALNMRFTFGSPHLAGVLFSPQKGLFFWSPVLLLAIAGMVAARGWARWLVVPTVIVFAVNTYLVASWPDWQFGGSYGHRAFTDGLGLLAVFMAAFFAWVAARPRTVEIIAVAVSACVALSVIQMVQYWLGIVPIADTTWAQYRTLFLKLW